MIKSLFKYVSRLKLLLCKIGLHWYLPARRFQFEKFVFCGYFLQPPTAPLSVHRVVYLFTAVELFTCHKVRNQLTCCFYGGQSFLNYCNHS